MPIRTAAEAVGRAREWVVARREQPGQVWGRSTGFPSWDRLTGGLHGGEVTVVGARTSVGKTAFALQVALAVAASGGIVLFVSPEMTDRQLILRAAAQASGVSLRRLAVGDVTPQEHAVVDQALEAIARLPLHLWTGEEVDLSALEARSQEAHHLNPLALLVVDYLNLIRHQALSPYERATEISRRIRALANQLEIPVLLLSQLRRPAGGDEKPPSLYDLRDSGNIEQDADNVLLLWRSSRVDSLGRVERENLTVADLVKQRNGPTGSFQLLFCPDSTRFDDLGGGR